jgi:hypothetical protein
MTTRKLLVFAIALIFSFNLFGQDQKSVRFGMLVTPQIDWLRSGTPKDYLHDGVNGKFGFGLSLEFRLTDVVHFMTGIGGTFAGGGETYIAGTTPLGYYMDNSLNPVKISDLNNQLNSDAKNSLGVGNGIASDPYWNNHTPYRLLSRVYKTTYVTIPLALKMMTKPIGPLKYFGVFGGNIEILASATATDQLTNAYTGQALTQSGVDVKNDCNLFKASLNVGAGAEYTLSGTTALTFGINYLRAFTSMTSSPSDYLIKGNANSTDPKTSLAPGNNTGGFNGLSHSLYGDGIALTVGVLF